MPEFTYRSVVSAPAPEVFRWHERPDALVALMPRMLPVRVVSRTGGIRDGGRVVIEIGRAPIGVIWEAVHFGFVSGRQFCDEQVRGPFRKWVHVHRVMPLGQQSAVLEDHVEYSVGGGRVWQRCVSLVLRPLLRAAFAERHRIVRESMTPSRSAQT